MRVFTEVPSLNLIGLGRVGGEGGGRRDGMIGRIKIYEIARLRLFYDFFEMAMLDLCLLQGLRYRAEGLFVADLWVFVAAGGGVEFPFAVVAL